MSKIEEALDKIRNSEKLRVSNLGDNAEQFQNRRLTTSKIDSTYQQDEPVQLGNISDMQHSAELSSEDKAAARVIDISMSDRQVFNAFRDFRTTISQLIGKKSSPIIMITSSGEQAGTSFVAQNLAVAIALDETKTSLLIECNFANPSFKHFVMDEEKPGLNDYLKESEISVEEIIHPTGIPRMRIIPAGVQSYAMSEYFTNSRLNKLFAEIKQRYAERFIIVDAPDISTNADARILAQVCDYVILVVPYGKATEKQVLRDARAIGKEKLLGTVFNNQPKVPRSFRN